MAKPAITKRVTKGSALSYSELDTNFQNLADATISLTAGTGGTAVASDLNGNITLVAGTGVTLTGDNTAKTITINTAGTGTVNSGAQYRLAFYPTDGTTVDDLTNISVNPPGTTLYAPFFASPADSPINVFGISSDISNATAGSIIWNVGVSTGFTWPRIAGFHNTFGGSSRIDVGNNNNIDIQPRSGVTQFGNRSSGPTTTTITSEGTLDLIINTNSGTNSGSIVIADGVNGDITVASQNNIILTVENSVNKGVKIIEADIGDPGTPILVPSIQPAGTGNKLLVYASNELNLGAGTGNVIVESVSGDVEIISGAGTIVLDGDLDLITGNITTSTSNLDITIATSGTGVIVLDGDVTINGETGNTPVDDTATVAFLEIGANGQTYYLPLYQ